VFQPDATLTCEPGLSGRHSNLSPQIANGGKRSKTPHRRPEQIVGVAEAGALSRYWDHTGSHPARNWIVGSFLRSWPWSMHS